MEIRDNGKSFNVHFVLLAKGKKHLGVLGMRETGGNGRRYLQN